jgi:hypothetical protein
VRWAWTVQRIKLIVAACGIHKLTGTVVVVSGLCFLVSIFSSFVIKVENSRSMKPKVSEILEAGVARQVGKRRITTIS